MLVGPYGGGGESLEGGVRERSGGARARGNCSAGERYVDAHWA